jgi:Trypsin-co-occurring domain 1
MDDIVRFETGTGGALLVEVEDDSFGIERCARTEKGVVEAVERLDEVMAKVRPAIREVIEALRELAPDEREIEFGVKLNAELGALIAKTSVDAHFVVRLAWRRPGKAGTISND